MHGNLLHCRETAQYGRPVKRGGFISHKANQQVAAAIFRDKPINAIFDGSIVLVTEKADGVLAKFSGGEPSMK